MLLGKLAPLYRHTWSFTNNSILTLPHCNYTQRVVKGWFVRLWMSGEWRHDRLIHQLGPNGRGQNGWSHSHYRQSQNNLGSKPFIYLAGDKCYKGPNYHSVHISMWVSISYIHTYIIPHVSTHYIHQNVYICISLHTHTCMLEVLYWCTHSHDCKCWILIIDHIIIMKCDKLQVYNFSISFTSPNLLIG